MVKWRPMPYFTGLVVRGCFGLRGGVLQGGWNGVNGQVGRTLETLRGREADCRCTCCRDESVVFAGAVDDEDPTVQPQEDGESGDDGEADRHA